MDRGLRPPPRYLLHQKLLKKVPDRTRSGPNQPVLNHQPTSPVARRIISVRDPRRRQVAQHIGVVRLPLPVISLADRNRRHRIKRPRPDTSLALIKITWVLMKNRRQNRAPKEAAG